MMTFYGATRGIVHGLLLEDLLLGEEGTFRTNLAAATFGSIAGAFLGFKAMDRTRLSIGQAELVGVMGDFGIAYGMSAAYIMDLYDDDEGWQRFADAVILTASGCGLGGGRWLSKREDYSAGDAYVLRAAGILGAHLALPMVDATGTENGKAYAAGMTLGSVAGLGIANRLLRDQSFTFSEGLIITSGQIAGGLLGLGITYLLDAKEDFDELAYFSSSALGSLGGFALTFRAFSRGLSKTGSVQHGLHIELAPEAIAMLAFSRMRKGRSPYSLPILTVQF
jgi:hypothetical protein